MNQSLLKTEFAKVMQVNLVDDMDVLEIQHQHCQAKVSLYGGQVLSYQPICQVNSQDNDHKHAQKENKKDIFWLSKDAYYQAGKAIRGGIPLCWPWFGPNDKATQVIPSTNHGFAREVTWQVDSITADEKEVIVVLVLQGENQHALWPNRFKLIQTLSFGKTFKQSLSMTNLSTKDAQYSVALHSYFCVSNPINISIDALTGCKFDDKLTGKTSLQKETVSCVGPIDREYHIQRNDEHVNKYQVSTVVMLDKGWQRKIEITSMGCAQWVLWNPGDKLAATMADVHVGGEQEYVCLEAANSKWQPLLANETVTVSQEIKVLPI